MSRLPHVALLIETSRSYGRGVLRGVRRYLSEHGPWSVYLETRALDSQGPPWLKNWRGDGILTRTGSRALARLVRAADVPAVELRSTRHGIRLPWVGVDNRALGQLVAEHLLDRGFRRFGVCALDTEQYFRERCANYIEMLRQRGFPCAVFAAPPYAEQPLQWEKQQEELTDWLRQLPKPVGVMACTDQLGFWLLDACRRAEAAVPEEVAVVGVENDESLCAMATPPLSSVALNTERIGYVAAELLDRLMKRKRADAPDIFIEPLGIVTRQSSDVVAVEDEAVAAALRFIRENACAGIHVDDVLDAVPLSRSKLERDFRELLGRSPNAEIRRVQLGRVRQLLVETDLTLAAIAARSGFSRAEYLCAVFKEAFGATPNQYRAAVRA
jgi:LacI family transcriptional regulator